MPFGEGGSARTIYRGGTLERERQRQREGLSNEDRLLGDGPLFLSVHV